MEESYLNIVPERSSPYLRFKNTENAWLVQGESHSLVEVTLLNSLVIGFTWTACIQTCSIQIYRIFLALS